MVKEVDASLKGDGLKNFQADQQVSKDLEDIANALVVTAKPQGGVPACIYLGDILSDRFTNNQEAMSTFIHKLSGVDPQNPGARVDTGVRFIAGNHDTVPLRKPDGTAIEAGEQWGGHATKKLSFSQYQTLLLNCFKAADYSGGVLTTHNGVAKGEQPDEFLVGVGRSSRRGNYKTSQGNTVSDAMRISASGPEELAKKMNQLFNDRVEKTGGYKLVSTDFRPRDVDMTPLALDLEHVPGFRQLHGHEAQTNEAYEGVTNLNARGAGGVGGFKPVGMVIEVTPPTPTIPDLDQAQLMRA
jgi:hypothetical protein